MFERAFNYLSTIGIADVFDILIVAIVIYELLMLIRKTNSSNLARGIIIYLVALWLSAIFKLTMVNYALKKVVELGLIAVLILFQPEIRRAIEKVGSVISRGRTVDLGVVGNAISQTTIAVNDMSSSKTGALIIFERSIRLNEQIASGTIINSDVSAELIKNIFYNKAPLHDGALIIRDGRIISAGSILPLSKNLNLSKDLGMRHRAGLGMSEQSDAVVIIVSEETGDISVALEGMLKRHLKSNTLDKLLRKELLTEVDNQKKFNIFNIIDSLTRNNKESEEE